MIIFHLADSLEVGNSSSFWKFGGVIKNQGYLDSWAL